MNDDVLALIALLLIVAATVALVLIAAGMIFGLGGVVTVILIAGAYLLGLLHGSENRP